MSDSAWLSYVGAATGIIGAITGITGAALGYISYRRSGRLKALDLRIEVRRADVDHRNGLNNLLSLVNAASHFRIAVASASGRLKSGNMELWRQTIDGDRTKVELMLKQLPEEDTDYSRYSHEQLETRLVKLHSMQSVVSDMTNKYVTEIAKDDKDRERLQHAMTRIFGK